VTVTGIGDTQEPHPEEQGGQIPVKEIQEPPGPLPFLEVTDTHPENGTDAEHGDKVIAEEPD